MLPRGLVLATALGACLASPSIASTIHVHLDTSEWRYHRGYLLFTYVTSVPDSIPLQGENRVRIRNFRTDGQMGQDDTIGGVSGGKNGALASQPYRWTIDPDAVPELLGDKGRYRYNEIPVNFAKRYLLDPDAVWFGTYIDFEFELPDSAYVPAAIAPDAFTISVLNEKREPAFPTDDPLEGDALVACSPKRGTKGWHVEAYGPAVDKRTWGGRVERIDVRLPPPSPSAGGRVAQIHLSPSIRKVSREQGVVWIEYSIPVATTNVRLQVFDSQGKVRFRRELDSAQPGTYGWEWPERGGVAPPPGRYRVVLECAGKPVERMVDL